MCQVVAYRSDAISFTKDFVLMIGKDIAGRAQIVVFHTKSRMYAEIHDVMVVDAYRGRGFAHRLMEGVEDFLHEYAQEQQADVTVRLSSLPERQAANRLYKTRGYQLLAAAGPGGTNYYGLTVKGGADGV